MPQEPLCPECRTAVQPSWDWCMACGYDPEGLRPTAAPVAPSPSRAPVATAVTDVRPQQISDPDWVPQPPRRRLSLIATAGVLAAILVAIAGLVFVILMVLNQPVGTTQADARGISAPAVASAR